MFEVAREKTQRFAGFDRWSGQDNARHLLLLQRCHRHPDCKISFARTGRANSKNRVVLLNCLNVGTLVCASRHNRRLAQGRCDFRRNNVAEIFIAFFGHGLEGIIKFVSLNIDALLARFFKLFEHVLRFIDAARVPLEFYPALTRGHLHAKGVLEVLQKLNVIGVERLQRAWAVKLQSPRFSHNRGIGFQPTLHRHDADATKSNLPETIHQRPMCAFLRRFFNAHYDKIATGRFWNNVCSGKVAFLPSVRFFRKLAV